VRVLTLMVAGLLLASVSASYAAQVRNKSGVPAQKQAEPAKVTDPVCGMKIDPAKAAGKSDYKGKTYYFCSDHCKKTFDAKPEAVVNKDSKKK
jgi:YHS domain-containing protein